MTFSSSPCQVNLKRRQKQRVKQLRRCLKLRWRERQSKTRRHLYVLSLLLWILTSHCGAISWALCTINVSGSEVKKELNALQGLKLDCGDHSSLDEGKQAITKHISSLTVHFTRLAFSFVTFACRTLAFGLGFPKLCRIPQVTEEAEFALTLKKIQADACA